MTLYLRCWLIAALLSLPLFSLAGSRPAHSQGLCATYKALVQRLDEIHSEKLAYRGITDIQTVFEIFISDDSWTVLTVSRGGIACITATGSAWQVIPRSIGGKKI